MFTSFLKSLLPSFTILFVFLQPPLLGPFLRKWRSESSCFIPTEDNQTDKRKTSYQHSLLVLQTSHMAHGRNLSFRSRSRFLLPSTAATCEEIFLWHCLDMPATNEHTIRKIWRVDWNEDQFFSKTNQKVVNVEAIVMCTVVSSSRTGLKSPATSPWTATWRKEETTDICLGRWEGLIGRESK